MEQIPQRPAVQNFGAVSLTDTHLMTGFGVYPLNSISSVTLVAQRSETDAAGIVGVLVGLVLVGTGWVQCIDASKTFSPTVLGGLLMAAGVASIIGGFSLGKMIQGQAVLVTMAGGESITVSFARAADCSRFLPAIAGAIQRAQHHPTHIDARQIHVHNPPPREITP